MLELIVFDLAGTLVDSRKDIANAANATIESFGGKPIPDEDIVGMVGEGSALLVRRALRAAGVASDAHGALETFLRFYERGLLNHTRPYPGMENALAQLHNAGVAMAVLTNKPQRATDGVLDGLGLRGFFRDVIGGDTAFGRKPDPAGLLVPDTVTQLGVRPHRIDLLNSLSGVSVDEALAGAVFSDVGGHHVRVLGLEELRRNKLATGRESDLRDVAELDRITRRGVGRG